MIRQPGTIDFWITPEKNSGAFTSGVNYTWASCQIGTDGCTVISEGENLIGVMNSGTDREWRIFSVVPPVERSKKHMVTVTWDTERLKLYFDASILHEISFSDFP
jgi:hypothetical protein